jgi:hypothetical protein
MAPAARRMSPERSVAFSGRKCPTLSSRLSVDEHDLRTTGALAAETLAQQHQQDRLLTGVRGVVEQRREAVPALRYGLALEGDLVVQVHVKVEEHVVQARLDQSAGRQQGAPLGGLLRRRDVAVFEEEHEGAPLLDAQAPFIPLKKGQALGRCVVADAAVVEGRVMPEGAVGVAVSRSSRSARGGGGGVSH